MLKKFTIRFGVVVMLDDRAQGAPSVAQAPHHLTPPHTVVNRKFGNAYLRIVFCHEKLHTANDAKMCR